MYVKSVGETSYLITCWKNWLAIWTEVKLEPFLLVYTMIKKNCINETINVLEGNEDEIEWIMGEYGEGQSNYNQNPEAINEKINEFDYK